MCDLAEVHLREEVERRVLVNRQVAAMAGLDLPDPGAAQEMFTQLLEEPPQALDPEQEDLMLALGLR